MHDNSACAIYARRSSDSEDKQALSISSQIEELRKLAVERGIEIESAYQEDASAREPGRPVFGELIKRIEAGEVSGILCWRLDRLARNMVDGGEIIYLLSKGRLKEIVTPEATYTGTPDSKFMLALLFGAAAKYTDDLSSAVKRGNRAVYEEGRITGRAPIGYLKVRESAGRRGASPIDKDPERFDLVRGIWDAVLSGESPSSAWRRARYAGLTIPGTDRTLAHPISLASVYHLLRNPFYAGRIIRDGQSYPGEHEAMVTGEEFERAQDLLGRDDAPMIAGVAPHRHSFVYEGLLHCGHCTRVLCGEYHTNRQGHDYVYYRCSRRRQGYPECHAPAPREEQVTEDILAALRRVTIDGHFLEWAKEALDWWAMREPRTPVGAVHLAEQALKKAERELETLTDLVVDGRIEVNEYTERRTRQMRKIDELRQALSQSAENIESWGLAKAEVTDFSGVLVQTFTSGDVGEKRDLLKRLCSDLIVTRRRTQPLLRVPFTLRDN